MLVMGDEWTWWGVPIRMASVLELLSCKKFNFIHAFISSRQVVSVDDGDGDDRAADDGDNDGRAAEGSESVLRYSCVSSA